MEGGADLDVDAYRCSRCGLLALYAGGSPQHTQMAGLAPPDNGPQGGLTPPAPSPFTDSP
jgi:hypothetical protein